MFLRRKYINGLLPNVIKDLLLLLASFALLESIFESTDFFILEDIPAANTTIVFVIFNYLKL